MYRFIPIFVSVSKQVKLFFFKFISYKLVALIMDRVRRLRWSGLEFEHYRRFVKYYNTESKVRRPEHILHPKGCSRIYLFTTIISLGIY